MKFLKKLFKPTKYRLRATFHMKSGKSLVVMCDDITNTVDPATGSLRSYSIAGVRTGDAHFFNIPEVEAITFTAA